MMTDNQWDKTTRMIDNTASASNDADYAGDRTLKAPSSMMAAAQSNDEPDYESTRRSDMSFAPQESEESLAGHVFMLKGEGYREVKCLSDNSGEAQVFLVEKDGKEFVLKVYYPNFDVDKKLLQTIRSFHFEMIVRLFDYGKTYVEGKNRNYELMEYLRGGTLKDLRIEGNFNRFRRLVLQAAGALAYCHKNNILHKDIKPTNFFFRDESQQELVLGDFGISSLQTNGSNTFRTTQARTPIYAAPEMYTDVIDGEVEITPAADFYSLGMTLFAAWLGENPMSSNERLMMRQKNEGRLPRMDELPDQVKKLIQGLTSVNKMTRWGYDEVERWFLGEDVAVDISSPFLRYKSFIVDPDRNLVAENVHELVPMLLENEQLGKNYLYNGRIVQWLEACGNTKLSAVVNEIVTQRYPTDQRAGLYASAFTMDSSQPYRDIKGVACEDVHSVALSLLSHREEYSLILKNANDPVFIWLESRTKCHVDRLRSYFNEDCEPRISLMRLVLEIDPDIPFLTHRSTLNIQDIVQYFGNAEPTEDEWHSLCDGRLLSWLYVHEDMVKCDNVMKMTAGKEFSMDLAYKVLYSADRTAAYDLREAQTPQAVGDILANQLKQLEHVSADELANQMSAFSNTEDGRFYFFAEIHGWYDLLNEAKRCFDMNSEENRERLGAYDLRTALYRFCRSLGVIPTYLLPNGTLLSDGKQLDANQVPQMRTEIRNGALSQWLSVFFHEDPTRDFQEEYSYERELEAWLMAIGSIDPQQFHYRRFAKAREDTKARIAEVRREWNGAQSREKTFMAIYYIVCFIWVVMVLFVGFSNKDYVMAHPYVTIGLPVGGMTAIIVATRSYFNGYGSTIAALWGIVGALTVLIPIYTLRFVYTSFPQLFTVAVLLLTGGYMVVCHYTDFRKAQQTDAKFVNDVLKHEDLKSVLIDPLYYTFKTRSHRYKGSKFGLLDNVADQVHSLSGETVLHYIQWAIMILLLVGEFVLYSPSLMNMKNPDLGKGYISNFENVVGTGDFKTKSESEEVQQQEGEVTENNESSESEGNE
ncbi:serine/threonine protein kinase [Xylanibacter brevis]|uniref:serine/threonine protein kinase n=1 Tax=Xylanibacter brevis TaxID=83231 RepID=UPI0009DF9419|nr:protein kinase [Xylanibacter brevis]